MKNDKQFRKWGEAVAPCKGCSDRCIGCHGQDANGLYKCERYGEFKAQNDAQLEVRRELIRQNDEIGEVLKGARRCKR